MLHCNKCKVGVQGSPLHCPLCQSELSGQPDPLEDIFPIVPVKTYAYRGLIAFIAFCSVVVVAVSVAVNISLFTGRWWFLFVIAGITSLWMSFLLVKKKRKNVPRNILLQVFFLPLIMFLWDLFTGFHKWSYNFVTPILFSCAMIGMATFAKIQKLQGGDYIIYLMIISLFSVFSLLLILFNIVTIVYPSAVCFGLSIISMAYLIIMEGKSLAAEILRRTHL